MLAWHRPEVIGLKMEMHSDDADALRTLRVTLHVKSDERKKPETASGVIVSMLAFSAPQPQAFRIIRGDFERIEIPARFDVPFAGRLIIHANSERRFFKPWGPYRRWWSKDPSAGQLVFGAFLGIVEGQLIDDLSVAEGSQSPSAVELRIQKYVSFPKPIPFDVPLGLFNVPETIAERMTFV